MQNTTICDNPVFIVGAPRSGTTLLRSQIDAHPNICCPPWETGLFVHMDPLANGDITKVLKKEPTFPISRCDIVAWVRRSADDLMGQFLIRSAKRRWAEKTPTHVDHMDLISEVYPKSQFIHIIRDGRDVIRSLQNMPWAPRQIRWSADRWIQSVRNGRKFGELNPDRYTEIRYEKLVEDPQGILTDTCRFLQEPFSKQMLDFNAPENNSFGVTREPLTKAKKNPYRALTFYERIIVNLRAGQLLRDLGY